MQLGTIFRVLGTFLIVFSLSMLPPVAVNFIYGDGNYAPFIDAFFIILSVGFILRIIFRNHRNEIKIRDGFLIVVLYWIAISCFAAIPLLLSQQLNVSVTDILFETVSGFTTTGASVLLGVDHLPHAILYYRQQLQFLGGMGIIVLAVAIMPMLGVGGMQLYRAETPGPIKDTKLTPRITETAKSLWYLYVLLNLVCALAYWAAGMTLFDAIGEAFGTISTGGFCMHDASFAFYRSNTIELIGAFFMLLGSLNFSLHYAAIQKRHIRAYFTDEEARAYILFLTMVIALIMLILIIKHSYADVGTALVKTIFNVMSMASTTGFISAPFASWPLFVPVLIMVCAIVGGCAGSTSGGAKVMRMLLLRKQVLREVQSLIHPHAVVTIKFNQQLLPDRVLQSMWAFLAAYVFLFVLLIFVVMADGTDLTSAFGAVAGSIANAGAGIGNVSATFKHLTDTTKWALIFAMIAGRLEIFTLLVVFTPAFWRP